MMNTTTHAARLLALGAVFGLAAVTPAQKTTLTLGVYTTDKPATMVAMFSPVTTALSTSMTREMAKPVEVELRVFMTYESALTALVKGKVDIARFGPASYVLAKARNAKIDLLAMESKGGKKTFFGLIVVRTDSPIKTMADLRGESFAFGNKNSTVGRFFAQEQLLGADIASQDLSKHDYLERHDKVFRAVQLREFAAGSLKSDTFDKLNKLNQLRVLSRFEVPTKPWAVRGGLAENVVNALRKSLIGLTDKAALKSLKVSGFLPTDDKEYAIVRASMLSTMKFDVETKPEPGPPKAKPAK